MPNDMTGLEQNKGKIIVDARGTVKQIMPPELEVKKETPEVKSAGQNLVEKAATAIAGGLVAEGLDAIQDAAERARVGREVHGRDKEYENDPFKSLTYGELRVVLSTGSYGGKTLNLGELGAARNSRRLRYREAAGYGVMTGVGGILRSRLVDSEWTDYPAKIAEAAKVAEEEAMGKNEYRHNPRIQGVVSDAVSRTELLVRLDGYRGLTDLNNPKNVERLRQLKIADINKEIRALEARIANEVLWDPEGGKYAGLVNQETPRQREERLEKEKVDEQRRHEQALAEARVREARAKADAEAAAKAPKGAEKLFDMQGTVTSRYETLEAEHLPFFKNDQVGGLKLPGNVSIPDSFGPVTINPLFELNLWMNGEEKAEGYLKRYVSTLPEGEQRHALEGFFSLISLYRTITESHLRPSVLGNKEASPLNSINLRRIASLGVSCQSFTIALEAYLKPYEKRPTRTRGLNEKDGDYDQEPIVDPDIIEGASGKGMAELSKLAASLVFVNPWGTFSSKMLVEHYPELFTSGVVKSVLEKVKIKDILGPDGKSITAKQDWESGISFKDILKKIADSVTTDPVAPTRLWGILNAVYDFTKTTRESLAADNLNLENISGILSNVAKNVINLRDTLEAVPRELISQLLSPFKLNDLYRSSRPEAQMFAHETGARLWLFPILQLTRNDPKILKEAARKRKSLP